MIRGVASRIGARPLIRSRVVAFGSKSTSGHPQNTEGTGAATGKSRVISSLEPNNVKGAQPPRGVGSPARKFKGPRDQTLPNWQNEHIQAGNTPKDVMAVITSWKRKKNYNHINCFLALERLVQVGKGSEAEIRHDPAFQLLLTNLHGHLKTQPPPYPPLVRAHLLKALVALRHHPGAAFMDDLLSLWVADGLDKLVPTHLAGLVIMVNSIGHKPPPDFVRQVAEACMSHAFAKSKCATLADLVYGLWRMQDGPPPVDGFLDALAEACVSRGPSKLGCKKLPTLLMGLTRMYGDLGTHPQLFRVLLEGATAFGLGNFEPYDFAIFVKAAGSLPLRQEERTRLLGECERALMEGDGFARFETRSLMTLFYGLSQLGRPKKELIRAFVSDCASRGFHRLEHSDLAGIFAALHRMDYRPSDYILKQLAAACRGIDYQQPKGLNLSQVAFSFARFDYHDPELMDTLVASWHKPPAPAPDTPHDKLRERVRDMTNLMHGLGTLMHFPGHTLLRGVTEACAEMGFQHFRPLSQLGVVLQNLTRLNHHPGIEWVNAAVSEYASRPDRDLRFHDLSMLMWLLAAIGLLEPLARSHPSFPPLMARLVKRMEFAANVVIKAQARREQEGREGWRAEQVEAALARDDFSALTHALAVLELAGSGELRDVRATLQSCLERLGPIDGPPSPSSLQRSVTECLQAMGFETMAEPLLRGPLSLDAVLLPLSSEASGVPLGVEVDGPFHFFRNKLRLRNGRAAYKYRLMSIAVRHGRLAGFIKVPYYKWWRALKNHATQEYLLSLLMQTPADLSHYLPPDRLKRLPAQGAETRQEAQGTEEAAESGTEEGFTAEEMRQAQQEMAPTAPPVEMPEQAPPTEMPKQASLGEEPLQASPQRWEGQ